MRQEFETLIAFDNLRREFEVRDYAVVGVVLERRVEEADVIHAHGRTFPTSEHGVYFVLPFLC